MIPSVERDRLAVVARYDSRGGIEIEGASGDLQRLSDILVSADLESVFRLTIPESGDAAPYDGFLSSICVLKRGEKARIARRGDSIRVEGSEAALGLLSQSIKFLADKADDAAGPVPLHMHEEPYDGHPYMELDSEPLIVALRRQNEG